MAVIENLNAYFDQQKKDTLKRKLAKRGYDGANSGRRTNGWVTPSTSANSEINPGLSKLRDRSRDLVRNNPYANKALRVLVSNSVGTGIIPSITNKKTQELWKTWVKESDADGQLNFYGLQRLIGRTIFESGECLIRFRYRRPEDGLSVPLQIQVLEPDYLDSNKNVLLPNGGYIQNGIEYDPIGKRAAYWLYKQHPGENNGIVWQSLQSSRVIAEDIIHVYEKLRPGQSRGVPIFAPAMITTNDLDEYEEATLVRKAAEACITAIVEESDSESRSLGIESTEPDTQRRLEELAPGQIEYINSGESITFNNPPASQGYGEYINTRLHSIAAGIGITYEQMTGDLSQVNYSSIRAGTLDFRREIEQFQWLTFIPIVCERIMDVWLKTAAISNGIKSDIAIDWTTPKWDWVDPLKDIRGEEMEIGNNLKSWSEGARQRGYNPQDLLNEIISDRKMFSDAGIPYPSDKVSPNSQQPDTAQAN